MHSLEAAIAYDEKGEPFERAITLADVDRLHRAIRFYDAKLVIVDVLMAYMPDTRDSHRDQDVRSIFAPLSRIAADTGCTILVLRHLNKAKGGNPLYRGGGSIAIVGAARVGLLVAKCATEDDETLCAFAVQKNNLSAKPETLTYRIVECTDGAGKVQWVGCTDKSVRELLADVERDPDDDGGNGTDVYTVAHECEMWLRDFLTDKSVKRSAVVEAGTTRPPNGHGFSLSAINRTASKLKVVIKDSETFPRFTWWSLPDHSHLNLDDPPTGHEMTGTTEMTETTGADQQECSGRKTQSSQSSHDSGDWADCGRKPDTPPGGPTDHTPG